jgi:hypothetical protein
MKPAIILRVTLLATVCLLASRMASNAQVVNGNFEDPTSPYFLNGNNGYSDQYPGYNNFPEVIMFNGWESASQQGGLRYNEISTAGYSGADSTYAVQGLDTGAAIESLNPVTTIESGVVYTLTLSLNLPAGISGTSFYLLATTQGPNYGTYSYNPSGQPGGYISTMSDVPVISTKGILASDANLAGGSTGATAFDTYTISFDTLNGDNAYFVGDGLSVLVDLGTNGSTGAAVTDIVVTPEPSTWALMLVGAVGLLFIGRRKLQI